MAQIAASSNNRCVHRGISTMRLALGYKTGLPKDWSYRPSGEMNGWCMRDEIRQILQAFPKHQVVIYCFDDLLAGECKRHAISSRDQKAFEVLGEGWHDDHILGFSYCVGPSSYHFLIGCPTPDMRTMYVVAVSIKKTLLEKMKPFA